MQQAMNILTDLSSSHADVRFAAWRAAGDLHPDQIAEVGKLAASTNPGIAKAAKEALTTLTHSVGKDPANPKRAGVVNGLLGLVASGAADVKVHAMRLLSHIAGEDSVPAIAKYLADAALREEAIYCLERIPGEGSIKAVMTAYAGAPDDFKPRLLAALGHRRAAAATALCAEAMRSTNAAIAAAGAKAAARIGKAPTPQFPQGPERADNVIRFAEWQAREGNPAEASRLFKSLLDDPAAHVQCAAVIGLSKLRTADAAAAILPKTKSTDRTVRITARNAWKSMT
jgi:HEAT repeat protein